MMTAAVVVIRQILIMFMLVFIGFLLYKGKLISKSASDSLGNILLYVSLPAVIVRSFLVERTEERLIGLLISAGAALIILIVFMLLSSLFFRKDGVAAFAAAFSNPGFFGVPLIAASLSEGAVFYIAAFIGFLNLFQWTYGVALLTGKRGGVTLKRLFTAPFLIAIVIGLILFLTKAELPVIVTTLLSSAAGMNTPLAMFVIGAYLAQTDLKRMFLRKSNYLISIVRLLILPLLAVLLLLLVPTEYSELKTAILIAAACPVGSNVAVYANKHGCDYAYASETVIVSTLLSVVTIPLMMMVSQL